MDPFATLGLGRSATPEEITAAYRALAKRWHPDRAGVGADAVRRMAEINAAYDRLRDGAFIGAPPVEPAAAAGASGGAGAATTAVPRPARRPAGHWLSEELRRALGRELLGALQEGEQVERVLLAATWKSPRTLLALTDRRLLWLLDDAISNRVHSLRWRDVGRVEHRGPRLLRRSAVVRVQTTLGRKLEWAELTPEAAADLAGRVGRAAGLEE